MAAGFATIEIRDINLRAGSSARADAKLQAAAKARR